MMADSPHRWRAIAPHRPLPPGDRLHVERGDGAGQRIADLLRASMGPLLIAGSAGCGKSTELAQAAAKLANTRMCCVV